MSRAERFLKDRLKGFIGFEIEEFDGRFSVFARFETNPKLKFEAVTGVDGWLRPEDLRTRLLEEAVCMLYSLEEVGHE